MEKHKPTNSAELVGNGTLVSTLRTWLNDWYAIGCFAMQETHDDDVEHACTSSATTCEILQNDQGWQPFCHAALAKSREGSTVCSICT